MACSLLFLGIQLILYKFAHQMPSICSLEKLGSLMPFYVNVCTTEAFIVLNTWNKALLICCGKRTQERK